MLKKNTPKPTPNRAPEGLKLITPEQAAERLGLVAAKVSDPKRCVLRLVRRGRLRPMRVGKYTMIDPRSVDAYIDRGF